MGNKKCFAAPVAKPGNIVLENNGSFMCIINNEPTFEDIWGDFLFCYRACSLANFDLVLPYFVPIHPVFMSYIP